MIESILISRHCFLVPLLCRCSIIGVGLCYFPFISWLGAPYDESHGWSKEKEIRENKDIPGGKVRIDTYSTQQPTGYESQGTPPITDHSEKSGHRPADEVEKMMSAVAIATVTASLAESISHSLHVPSLSVPISTVLAVIMATAFPQQLHQLTEQGELLGKLLLLLFFASIGNASGTIASTFAATGAIYLLAFGIILYAVHLTVVLGIGKMCGIPMPDLLMAINPKIVNSPTTYPPPPLYSPIKTPSFTPSLSSLHATPLNASFDSPPGR